MTNTATAALSVVVERELPHPPERIWRALTQPHLIEEWLMKNDFKPVVDHRFSLRADWGAVDCQVMAVEPNKTLSYTWAAYGLESVVTWTLTPTRTGTRLRMEQSGFRPDQQQAYQGAKHGWQQFFGNLEQILARTYVCRHNSKLALCRRLRVPLCRHAWSCLAAAAHGGDRCQDDCRIRRCR